MDTMDTVYLITFALSAVCMIPSAAAELTPPFISAPMLELVVSYKSSLCCSVYNSGAPKIAIVARIGMDSGQIILRKMVQYPAPSINALSSSSAGIDSMYVFTSIML